MAAHPAPKHMRASRRLTNAIDEALPSGWDVFQEVDLDLQLAPPDKPGFVRAPDVVVVRTEAARRVDDTLSDPVSIVVCHLAGELGYADGGEITGAFRTTEPFPFELDLSGLTGRAS